MMNNLIEISSLDDEPVISLSKNNNENSINLNIQDKVKPSVNFGGGIELLMNDKKKSGSDNKSHATDINIDDINMLEDELNDLSTPEITFDTKPASKSGLFNLDKKIDKPIHLNEDNYNQIEDVGFESGIGKATANDVGKEEMNKNLFGNIPFNPDEEIKKEPKLTDQEILKEKFIYLRKLEALEKKGVSLSKRYSMDSPLDEMKGEYEMIISEKETSNSVKFQGRMLMAAITGLEFLNNKFDPFDVKLDGWSEQLNENLDDYDEIFGELHEKYKSKAKLAPELKLLFQLGGSAIMVHMTNTMFKSSMPGMDDIMRQNPELAQQFTQAAVNTMGDANPGFGGFMNSFMGSNEQQIPSGGGMTNEPPPSPINTKVYKSTRSQVPNNRPDLMQSREDNMPRAEMRGPSDISDLLAGMKKKKINIQESNKDNEPKSQEGSTISISDLKDLSMARSDGHGKRRKNSKSPKTTISLDI